MGWPVVGLFRGTLAEIVWVFRLRSLRRRGIDLAWSYWLWPLR